MGGSSSRAEEADIHCLGPPSEVLAHALQALHGRHESDNCVMERRFLRAKRRLSAPSSRSETFERWWYHLKSA